MLTVNRTVRLATRFSVCVTLTFATLRPLPLTKPTTVVAKVSLQKLQPVQNMAAPMVSGMH